MQKKMVFCIGLNKTGTTSLHAALKMLGYRPYHNLWEFERKIERAYSEGLPLLTYLSKYDAFLDIFPPANCSNTSLLCLSRRGKLLSTLRDQYPDSLFILTTRKRSNWIKSRKKHVLSNNEKINYSGDWLLVDEEAWKEEWKVHNHEVSKCIPSNRLLVLRLCSGEGFEKLCPFLGAVVLQKKFPRKRKSYPFGLRKLRIFLHNIRYKVATSKFHKLIKP